MIVGDIPMLMTELRKAVSLQSRVGTLIIADLGVDPFTTTRLFTFCFLFFCFFVCWIISEPQHDSVAAIAIYYSNSYIYTWSSDNANFTSVRNKGVPSPVTGSHPSVASQLAFRTRASPGFR